MQDKQQTQGQSGSRKAYRTPQGEEHLYHCSIERVEFDAKTGERLSRPVVQKFGRKEFERFMKRSLEAQGYTVEILHDPDEGGKAQGEAPKDGEVPDPDEGGKAQGEAPKDGEVPDPDEGGKAQGRKK